MAIGGKYKIIFYIGIILEMWNYEWATQKNTSCDCHKPLFGLPANTSKKLCDHLEILQNTHNINLITTIFSNLGILIFSKNIGSEIVKYGPLYEKILSVLNSGLQLKITVTLNFISALLYLDEDGPTRKKALYIYTQNMLRSSGCLTAMSNILASFMLHQETLKALCHSISETIRDSSINQSFCSHLVPLCIQKCRSGSSEIFAVLQSLLNKHKRNVQLFHQNNGMVLFSRDTMQSTLCLQLLNTVVENAESEEREIILNSSHIFEYLLNVLKKYGASTPVSQWASIILYSYQKVLGININMESILSNVFVDEHKKSVFTTSLSTKQYTKHYTINPELNETKELFRNILNEIIVSNGRRKFNDDIRFQLKCENTNSNIDSRNRQYLKARERQNNISKPQNTCQNNDLSFSFLLHETETQNKVYNPLENYRSNSNIKDQNLMKNCSYKYDLDQDLDQRQHFTQNGMKIMNANKSLLQNSDKESTLDFKPFFASTPKKRKTIVNLNSISRASSHTMRTTTCRSRDSNITKISRTKRENKKMDNRIKNKTVSSKFLDIVNASCTTIVKSFTTFKNIFKSKKVSEKNDSNTDADTCSYSFTNYMRERDAILKSNKKNIEHSRHSIVSSYRSFEANTLSNCNTCNDTIALKQKLANNSSLQRTVKRLKMGINLYGCDFKKISKAMWPQEKYMTPSVLYNLYRKLIIK